MRVGIVMLVAERVFANESCAGLFEYFRPLTSHPVHTVVVFLVWLDSRKIVNVDGMMPMMALAESMAYG